MNEKILRYAGVFLVVSLLLLHTSMALFGLCSRDWFRDQECFDNNDECKQIGGTCTFGGFGDHNEGCKCIKKVIVKEHIEYITLVKDHLKNNNSFNVFT